VITTSHDASRRSPRHGEPLDFPHGASQRAIIESASQAGRRRFDSGRPLQRRRGVAGHLQPRVRVDAAFVRACTLGIVHASREIRCRRNSLGSSLSRATSRLEAGRQRLERWGVASRSTTRTPCQPAGSWSQGCLGSALACGISRGRRVLRAFTAERKGDGLRTTPGTRTPREARRSDGRSTLGCRWQAQRGSGPGP
jgi:hypothetical protein